jgi:hypothetical protein
MFIAGVQSFGIATSYSFESPGEFIEPKFRRQSVGVVAMFCKFTITGGMLPTFLRELFVESFSPCPETV